MEWIGRSWKEGANFGCYIGWKGFVDGLKCSETKQSCVNWDLALISLLLLFTELSYCFSDIWNSFILSFEAPIHSRSSYDVPISGSSNGLESPRKKCSNGTANNQLPSGAHSSVMILLQRSSIPPAAHLHLHETKRKHFYLPYTKTT